MKLFSWPALFLALLALTGCAGDQSKDYDGAIYYQMGMQAEQRGDLKGAREYYARAMKNAKSGHLGPAKEAYASYGWGRVSGYLGFYADAEKGFNETLVLIQKSDGDADALQAPVLFELSRLFHDTGQHPKAVVAYARAFAELDRRGGERIDPWAYIAFLDDYAESLRATGAENEANAIAKRSAAMKEANKTTKPRVALPRYKT